MKQIIYRMCIALCLCAVAIGCEDNYEEYGKELYPIEYKEDSYNGLCLSPSQLTYLNGNGVTDEEFNVFASDQLPWQFTGLPSWIAFSQMSGVGSTEGTYSVEKNSSVVAERSAYFYLESMRESFPIKYPCYAHQYAQPTYFSVSPSEKYYSYGPEGGTLVLNIKTNYGWHVREPSGQTDFVYFSTVEDSADCVLTLVIPPYDYLDGVSRSNTYYIYDNAVSKRLYEFQITQTPPESSMGVINETLNFKKEAATQSVYLGKASSYSVECDLAWATVTPTSGSENVNLQVSVLPNTTLNMRSGYAYVYVSGKLKAKIFIVQEGHIFSLSTKSFNMDATGGTKTIALSSDGKWYATSTIDWATISPAAGEAGMEHQISITIAANKSLDNRKGNIVFKRIDGIAAQQTLEVYQFGRYFSPGDWKAGVMLGPDQQSATCEFNGDLAWTASTTDEWITLLRTSGSPEMGHSFGFSVTANTTQESRVGEILITYEGGETKIPVVQESAYINTSANTIELSSLGGTHVVSIVSNGEWSAFEDVDWMDISYKHGGTEITLNVSDNPSPNDRVATISIVSSANKTEKKLSILQKGRYLKASVAIVNFFLKGGEQRFDFESDGKLAATSSQSWLSATIESGNILVLNVAENNTGQDRSAIATVYVTGLTSGELKHTVTVNQLNTNIIERVEFGDDESIDLGTGGQTDIEKGEYGTDKELNLTPTGGITIGRTGFGTDKDLN